MVGVVPWTDVLERAAADDLTGTVEDLMRRDVIVAYPDENLREVAERMAARRVGVLPVIERSTGDVCGIITQFDLLAAQERVLQEERDRERVLRPKSLRSSN
jgi:CBS domain-containing protein